MEDVFTQQDGNDAWTERQVKGFTAALLHTGEQTSSKTCPVHPLETDPKFFLEFIYLKPSCLCGKESRLLVVPCWVI